MELHFMLSGSTLFSTRSTHVPPIGSKITIRTDNYKKGLTPNSIIYFTISDDEPPHYDYSCGDLIVYIDVNGYELLKAGQE